MREIIKMLVVLTVLATLSGFWPPYQEGCWPLFMIEPKTK
jgi:hypothetical protein